MLQLQQKYYLNLFKKKAKVAENLYENDKTKGVIKYYKPKKA